MPLLRDNDHTSWTRRRDPSNPTVDLIGERPFLPGFAGNKQHKGEYANTVAQFADAIASGEAPELFGDGTQTRDFTHVSDVARACELAAAGELTGVYNVGTQEAYTSNEMVGLINDALGTDIDPEYINCPFDSYVHDTRADYSQFHEAAGWEPEIDFVEGVERVCAPYRETDAPVTN